MLLYELAMELGTRSTDVAEKAEALGLGAISPTSKLTPEQVEGIRSAYGRAAPGVPEAAAGSEAWATSAASAPAAGGVGANLVMKVVVGLVLVAAMAAVGYMALRTSSYEKPVQTERDAEPEDEGDGDGEPPPTTAALTSGP